MNTLPLHSITGCDVKFCTCPSAQVSTNRTQPKDARAARRPPGAAPTGRGSAATAMRTHSTQGAAQRVPGVGGGAATALQGRAQRCMRLIAPRVEFSTDLGGDELDAAPLTVLLALDEVSDLGVRIGKRHVAAGKHGVRHGDLLLACSNAGHLGVKRFSRSAEAARGVSTCGKRGG